MTALSTWDVTGWGVTDVLGVAGFALAVVLAIHEVLRRKPRLYIQPVIVYQRSNDAWHTRGIQILVANVGGTPVTVLGVTVNDHQGSGRPLPGTTRMPPELAAEPSYADNPRFPVVIEPGNCETWLAGRPWLDDIAGGSLDQWEPRVSVMWLRPGLNYAARSHAKRTTSRRIDDHLLP